MTNLTLPRRGSRETKYNNHKDEPFWFRMEARKGPYQKKREVRENSNNIITGKNVVQAKIKQKHTPSRQGLL